MNSQPDYSYIALFLVKAITMADIKTVIDAYRADNANQNPALSKNTIMHGPLAGRYTWEDLGDIVRNGRNGLSEDKNYIEWKKTENNPSLPNLLIHYEYAEAKKSIKMADIKATIEAYRKENNSKNPTSHSDIIISGPLAGQFPWRYLNKIITQGYRGLKDDAAYQGWLKTESKPSLPKLCKKMDAERQQHVRQQGPNLNGGP